MHHLKMTDHANERLFVNCSSQVLMKNFIQKWLDYFHSFHKKYHDFYQTVRMRKLYIGVVCSRNADVKVNLIYFIRF